MRVLYILPVFAVLALSVPAYAEEPAKTAPKSMQLRLDGCILDFYYGVPIGTEKVQFRVHESGEASFRQGACRLVGSISDVLDIAVTPQAGDLPRRTGSLPGLQELSATLKVAIRQNKIQLRFGLFPHHVGPEPLDPTSTGTTRSNFIQAGSTEVQPYYSSWAAELSLLRESGWSVGTGVMQAWSGAVDKGWDDKALYAFVRYNPDIRHYASLSLTADLKGSTSRYMGDLSVIWYWNRWSLRGQINSGGTVVPQRSWVCGMLSPQYDFASWHHLNFSVALRADGCGEWLSSDAEPLLFTQEGLAFDHNLAMVSGTATLKMRPDDWPVTFFIEGDADYATKPVFINGRWQGIVLFATSIFLPGS